MYTRSIIYDDMGIIGGGGLPIACRVRLTDWIKVGICGVEHRARVSTLLAAAGDLPSTGGGGYNDSDVLDLLTTVSINQLRDVDTEGAVNNQVLTWSQIDNKWKPKNIDLGTVSLSLNQLEDTDLDEVVPDESVLVWDAAINKWIAREALLIDTADDLPEGAINKYFTQTRFSDSLTASSIDKLNDVDSTGALNDQVLSWDSLANKWLPRTLTLPDLSINLSELQDVSVSEAIATSSVLSWDETVNKWTAKEALLLDTADDLPEGVSNKFYTDAKVNALIAASAIENLSNVSNITAIEGQVLAWDDTEWKPTSINLTSPVSSVNTLTGVVVLTTSNVAEGTNEYYTPAKVDARIDIKLSDVSLSDLNDVDVSGVEDSEILSWDTATSKWRPSTFVDSISSVNGQTGVVTLTSTDIAEGINKYYTDDRFDTRFTSKLGAALLSDLSDVTISSPSTGQVLTWNTNQWVAQTLPIGSASVTTVNTQTGNVVLTTDDISEGANKYVSSPNITAIINTLGITQLLDVDTSSSTDQQVLAWFAADNRWKPKTITSGSVGAHDINSHSDVVTSPLTNGQVLAWNSLSSKWENKDSLFIDTSDDIPEGSTQLYFTVERVDNVLDDTNLSRFSDVNYTSSFENGQLLAWNSTTSKWENKTVPLLSLANKGDLLAHNGTTQTLLPIGSTDNHVLTVDSSAPTGFSWKAIASGGSFTLPFTAKGDLVSYTGTTNSVLAVGTDNQVLTADSTSANGLRWVTPATLLSPSVKGDLISHNGTTPIALTVGADDQLLTADSTAPNGVAWKAFTQSLISHSDILITDSLVDNTALIYNNSLAKWQNRAVLELDNTDDLPEGSDNLYHTSERVDNRIGALNLNALSDVVYNDTPSTGEILIRNASGAWENSTIIQPTAKGQLVSHNGTDQTLVPIGVNNYVLTADSSAESGVAWKAPAPTSGGSGGGSITTLPSTIQIVHELLKPTTVTTLVTNQRGLFNWLGSYGGFVPYNNPLNEVIQTIGSSTYSLSASDQPYNLASRVNDLGLAFTTSITSTNVASHYVDFILPENILFSPTAYGMQHRTYAGVTPRNWQLLGATTIGGTWEVISDHVNQPPWSGGEVRTYSLTSSTTLYKCLRLLSTGVNNNTTGDGVNYYLFSTGRVEFWGTLQQKLNIA